jgi:hypothetical protein
MFCSLLISVGNGCIDNLRSGGKCRTIGWEGQGVVLVSRHLQDCSSRLCWLRIDGLASASKYWTYQSHNGDMSPVNLVVCCQQMFGFHYCFNDCVGRETRWQTHESLSRAGVVLGALFLGSSRVCPTPWMTCKRLPRTWTAHRKRTLGVHTLAWEAYMLCVSSFPLQSVHRFESPWLSDMSNRLSRGSLHVANLIA